MQSDSNGRGGASDPPPVPRDLPRDPVPPSSEGSGWPYAPQGWPNPDDKWGWKVGKRAAANFLWIDRYVSVPVSMWQGRRGVKFASRKSLEEYCRKKFPQMTDAANIFKAFDWKIPAPSDVEVYDAKRASSTAKGAATVTEAQPPAPSKGEATAKEAQPPPAQEGSRVNKRPASADCEAADGERRKKKKSKKSRKLKKRCRAGNPHCTLLKGKKNSGSENVGRLVCHICCFEPDFCRECKCILCCELLQQPNASAVAVVRCGHLPVPGQGSCGHAAHLECALNAQLAGVIEKQGVDIEYRCRRCDWKTDLKATVIDMVGAMNQNAPQSTAENVLQLALQTVQGSDDHPRTPARPWAVFIGDALEKIRAGVATSEVSKNLTLELNGLDLGAPEEIGVGAAILEIHENLTSGLQAGANGGVSGANGGVLGGDGVQEASGVSDKVINWSAGSPNPPTICIQPRLDTTSQVDKYFEFCHELASRLKQSVSTPPRLLLEDHILECKAMAERVRGAACEFKTLQSSTKVSIQERSKFESA